MVVENEITGYIHCSKCLEELPKDIAPKDWQQVQVGLTSKGLQVWCTRHECNVVHINFEGQKHPANVNF